MHTAKFTGRPPADFMTYLLIVLWFFIFCWLLIRWRLRERLGIKAWVVVALLALKLMAGAGYGWFFKQMDNYEQRADTWAMQLASIEETEWLVANPVAFVGDVFTPRYSNDTGLMGTQNSMMNDLKEVLFIKILAVFNLVSDGRYYVNMVIFNGCCMFGLLCFCRAMVIGLGRWALLPSLVSLFLFPTVLFWTSGLHKEGLLLALSGVLLLHLQRDTTQYVRWRWYLPVLVCSMCFFLLRPHAFMIFMMAAAFARLVKGLPLRPNRSLVALISAILVVIVLLYTINPLLPAQWLANRRADFLALSATDMVSAAVFPPDFRGLLGFTPSAMAYGILWPLPGMYSNPMAIVAGVENFLILLLVVFAGIGVRSTYRQVKGRNLIAFCVFYFVWSALLIGYTIPYLSPLLRYKSILLPFIVAPALTLLAGRNIRLRQLQMTIRSKAYE